MTLKEGTAGYPVWHGTWGWKSTSRARTMYGAAALMTAPGRAHEAVFCEHRHRKSMLAHQCGQRMAAERNADIAR